MGVTLAGQNLEEEVEMRSVYCATLMDLAGHDPRIVVLDADVMNSMGMVPFAKQYPLRTFNCGVQEANMIGVAAGLSATGKVPYAHSFGTFATRRAFDQNYLSAAYGQLNVRIVGSDPGITAAFNGGTHMALDDMGIMRSIPGVTVMEPSDSTMLADVIRQLADLYGVFYVRLMRKKAVRLYEPGSRFEIGKANIVRDGSEVSLIANGICVYESLKAADLLARQGISARVVDLFTLKPVDAAMILDCARETGAIVTVENHNIVNGLGSAVAEVLVENLPVPMERIGVPDVFGEVGPVDYLKERFGMTAGCIAAKALRAMARKNR